MAGSSHRPASVASVRIDTAGDSITDALRAFQQATEAQRYAILRRLIEFLENAVILASCFDETALDRCIGVFNRWLPLPLSGITDRLTRQRDNIRKMQKSIARLQDTTVPLERIRFEMVCIDTEQRIALPLKTLPEYTRQQVQVERARQASLEWPGLPGFLDHLFDLASGPHALTSLRFLATGVAWELRKHTRREQWLWGLFVCDGRGVAERVSLSVFPGGTGQAVLLATLIDQSEEGERFRRSIEHAKWAASRYLKTLAIEYREDMISHDLLLQIGDHPYPHGFQGASLGLPMAVMMVAFYLKTPLDRMTALTGELDAEGRVVRVTGIAEKIKAAASRDIHRVLVPLENAAEALSAAPEGIQVVGIKTLDEACDLLFRDHLIEQGYRAFPLSAASVAGIRRERRHTPFVGRTAEQTWLQQRINRALSGHGNLTIVRGEAGIGKTRLMEQVQAYARRLGMQVFWGCCFYQQAPMPYMPFLEALSILTDDGIERSNSDMTKPAGRQDASNLSEQTARLGQFIAQLKNETHALPPATLQLQLFEQIIAILRILMKGPGVLFCIEDLQWADSGSLQLLHYLARHTVGQRLCLLMTYRLEDAPDDQAPLQNTMTETLQRLSAEGIGETMTLDHLTDADIQELTQKLLDDHIVPAWLSDRVYEESEGNPLFAVELLTFWRENGVLDEDGLQNVTLPHSIDPVPPRIYDLIARRLKGLQEKEREILEVAAVGGTRFDIDGLTEILGHRRIDLLRQLHRLARSRGIVSSVDQTAYQFVHDKIREVLYHELPEALKAEYHASWGRFLLNRHEAGEDVPIGILATHLYNGGNKEQAIPFLCEAAEQARKVCAFREARWYWEQAEEALGCVSDINMKISQLDVWLKLGWVYFELGNWEAATFQYQKALIAVKKQAKKRIQAEALMKLGAIQLIQNNWDKSNEFLDQSLKLYRECQDNKGIASVLTCIGLIYFWRGELKNAKDYYTKALEAACLINNYELIAGISNNLGILAFEEGDDRTALRFFDESSKRHRLINNVLGIAEVNTNIGMVYERQKKWDKALNLFKKSIEFYERMCVFRHLGNSYNNYARILAKMGDLTTAEKICKKGYTLLKSIEHRRGLAESKQVEGLIESLNGNRDNALNCFHESKQLYEEINDANGYAQTLKEEAKMLFHYGNVNRAILIMRKAEQVYQKIGANIKVLEVKQELIEMEKKVNRV